MLMMLCLFLHLVTRGPRVRVHAVHVNVRHLPPREPAHHVDEAGGRGHHGCAAPPLHRPGGQLRPHARLRVEPAEVKEENICCFCTKISGACENIVVLKF